MDQSLVGRWACLSPTFLKVSTVAPSSWLLSLVKHVARELEVSFLYMYSCVFGIAAHPLL